MGAGLLLEACSAVSAASAWEGLPPLHPLIPRRGGGETQHYRPSKGEEVGDVPPAPQNRTLLICFAVRRVGKLVLLSLQYCGGGVVLRGICCEAAGGGGGGGGGILRQERRGVVVWSWGSGKSSYPPTSLRTLEGTCQLHKSQHECRMLTGSDARILIWDAQEAMSPDIALPQRFVWQLGTRVSTAHPSAGTAHAEKNINLKM